MTDAKENRQYTRLPLDIMVELHLPDGTRLYGETADISLDGAFVNLTPPSVNSMLKRLDQKGFIRRIPGKARAIELTIDSELIPTLDQSPHRSAKN